MKDFALTDENIPPSAREFEAHHLQRWLSQRAALERLVLEWVVRTSRRLDGLSAGGGWEFLQGEEQRGSGPGNR
jgi:hypothetical protein